MVENTHISSALSESRRAKREAEELTDALRHARVEWEQILRDRFRRHPYATIATAVGIGYVLGGGLVPGLLRPIAGVGTRIAIGMLLQNVLGEVMDDGSSDTATEE